MKNRKTRITRVLVIFSLLAVVLSAVLIPLSASKAGTDPILSGSDYGITYNDGVYTVSIDAERLAEILNSKSFNKETLLSIMPEKVYDLLAKRDVNSATALLGDLRDTASLDQLRNDLPIDYFLDLLSADELLEIIYTEKLLEIIDLEKIIASLDEEELESIFIEEKLEKLLESLDLEPILTREKILFLLDDTVNPNALTADEISVALKPGAINKLVMDRAIDFRPFLEDDDIINALFDATDIITKEEVESMLLDKTIIRKIVDDDEVLNEILHKEEVLEDIAAHPEVIDDLVTDLVIVQLFIDNNLLDDVIDDSTIPDEKLEKIVNDNGLTVSELTAKNVFDALPSDKAAEVAIALYQEGKIVDGNGNTVDNKYIHLESIDFEAVVDAIDHNEKTVIVEEIKRVDHIRDHVTDMIYADFSILADALNYPKLYDNGILTDDMILDVISNEDVTKILDRKIVTPVQVVENVKDTGDLVDAVTLSKLPHKKLLEAFDLDELVIEVMKQDFFGLIRAINFKNIIKIEEFKNEIKGLTVGEIKSVFNLEKAKELIVSKSSQFILTDLWAVTLNDNLVFHHDIGFDVASIEYALIDAIPTFDKIAEMDESGVAASFVIKYMIGEDLYTNGFRLVFTGDTTALKEYAAKLTEFVSFKINPDNSIEQSFGFPAKLGELYVSAVDGTKLPEALRVKLAEIANVEFNKSDIGDLNNAIISKLTIEELKTVISAVDVKNIDDKALEQLNIRQSQAQIVLDYATAAINKVFNIIETNPELDITLSSFYDKTLADFYYGNGNFTFEFETQFDTMEKIEKLKELPEDLKMFFTNTTLAHEVSFSVTLEGLYQASFVDDGEILYTAYRTEGTPLANITKAGAFAGLGENGWDAIMEDGSHIIDVKEMPAGDIRLAERHLATFSAYDFGGNLVDQQVIVFSEISHTLVDINAEEFAPTVDEIEHYVFAWDRYNVTTYEDFEVEGRYIPKTYTVTFMADGEVVDKVLYNVENTNIAEPTVPAKDHYDGAWEAYDLTTGGDKTVNAVYTPKTYTVTFMADGVVVDIVDYTIEDTSITAPAVPAKAHYDGEWETFDITNGGNLTVNAIYTAKTYTVTFKADGAVVGTATYTIENTSITAPAVPAKAHYDGAWEAYDLTTGGDKTVNAVYTAKTYTVTFKADGAVVGTATYTIEDTAITAPAVPAKDHYDGAWEAYTLSGGDKTVNAVYTAKTYTVTFKADGAVVGTVTYTIEDTSITAPAVPAKAGFTGVWEAYTLTGGDKTVNAIYTEIPAPTTYTITFMADGLVVGTVTYSIGDTSVAAPAVPAKAHYDGRWESYTLDGGDKIVNAIYSPKVYSVIFKADGVTVGTSYYTILNLTVTEPAVPQKAGYNGYWPSYALALTEGQIVNAIYIPKETPPVVYTYYITFMDENNNVYGKVEFTKNTPVGSIVAPEKLPEKEGYKAFWPEFKHLIFSDEIFNETGSYSFTVVAEYEAIKYYVTFVADGKEIAKVEYTVENKEITAPAVPEKAGFTGVWEKYDLTVLGDKTVNAIYTEIPAPTTYTVTFMADGKVVAKIDYTLDNPTVNAPAVPEKAGFTGVWEEYDLSKGGNITVNAIYTEIVTPEEKYYITFVDENDTVIEKIEFTKSTDASTIKAPATVPEKAGYNVYWPSFTLFDDARFEETGTYSFTVKAVYEAINYTATFVADGKVVAEITFTVETDSIDEPAIPAKDGYTAVWSSYVLGTEDITVDAIYSTISYKVTFVVDGEEVAVRYYTVENKTIDEPAVPEKEGFTGEWEKYTLDSGDKTVNAVYTEIEEGSGSLFWWIMIIILVIAAIILIIIFLRKSKKDKKA